VHVTCGGPGIAQMLIRLSGHRLARALGPFDTACVYEGEHTLLGLVRALEEKRPLRECTNVVVRDKLMGARWLAGHGMEDLKVLPAPDFDGLPTAMYFAPKLVIPYDPTRGCYWGKCTFCHYGLDGLAEVRGRYRRVSRARARRHRGAPARALREARYFYFSQDSVAPKTIVKLAQRCDRYGEIRYCKSEGEDCRRVGREVIAHEARRFYRDSPEGQAQHIDEERDRRQRRPGRRGRRARRPGSHRDGTDVQVVGDPPPSRVASEAFSWARNAAPASTEEAATASARTTSDDEPTDVDDGSPSGRDAAAHDGGPGRTDAGGAGAGDESASACGGDAARGSGALAPAGAVRCAVCRCWGRYVGTSAGRRVGFGVRNVHFEVEVALREQGRRSRRLAALGNFADLRQLCLLGVPS